MTLSTARRRRLAVLPTAAIALAATGLSSVAGALSAAAATTPTTTAAGSTVVISQVYGGGGNLGGVLANDFVELFNAGTDPVSVKGWSVQYASGTGTSALGATVATRTALPDVTIQPGRYLLVRGSQGDQPGQPALPTPDVTSANPIQFHESSGKVALVRGTASLGCNGQSLPCSPTQLGLVADLVGYGAADFAETAPTAQLTPRTAALRSTAGCVDTNSNLADFSTAGAPQPRNSASPVHECANVAQLKAAAAQAAADKAAAEAAALEAQRAAEAKAAADAEAAAQQAAAEKAEADRLAAAEKAEADRLAAEQLAAQAAADRLAAEQAAAAELAAAQAEADRLAAAQAAAAAEAAAAKAAADQAAADKLAADAAAQLAAQEAAAAQAAQAAAAAEAARLAAEAAATAAQATVVQQAAVQQVATETATQTAHVAATCRVLQPINCDNTSVFKLGSTIPVKFGVPTMAAGATFTFARTSAAGIGTQAESVSTVTPTAGGVFTLQGGQHHLNWSTKGLQTGTYLLTITGVEDKATVTYSALVTLR